MSDEKWTSNDRRVAEQCGWALLGDADYTLHILFRVEDIGYTARNLPELWEEIKNKIDTCPLHRKAYLLLIKRQLLTGRAPYE